MNTHRSCSFACGFLLAVFALGVSTAPARAQSGTYLKSSPKVVAAFRDVVAKPSECVVRIKCAGKDAALGTIISADGWIITKHSELKGTPVCKLKDGREFEACLVSSDERFDLALLKIECDGLKAVEWCESKCAPVGHWVASAGPGVEPVAIGVVSVAARNVPVGKVPQPVKPPSNNGYLGIGLDGDDNGARVTQVKAGSAAAKAGMKVNDVVLAVDGTEVKDAESLIAVLQRRKPGDVVALKIQRDDKEVEMKATLGKQPPGGNRSDFQNSLGGPRSAHRDGFPTILQHDTVIKPTDCGGPLVDLDGKVIGINIARAGRTESYAVPSEAIQPLLSKLMPEKVAVPRRVD